MKQFFKTTYKILVICILLIFFTYVCNITLLPNNMVLLQGQTLDVVTVFGLTLGNVTSSSSTIETSSNINNSVINEVGTINVSLDLFGLFTVKDITVDVVSNTTVVPVGKTIGMKIYTDGVMVIGFSEINGEKPYQNSNLQEGDRIVEINETKIDTTDTLVEIVNESNGESLNITYERDEEVLTTEITPVKTEEGTYKLGLWVRDSAAGLGTITFYEPSTGTFAALGHGITDIDTSEIISVSEGELVTAKILSVTKGESGTPGEIKGTIENSTTIGTITKNTDYGVYGTITNLEELEIDLENIMEVASRSEIELGTAQILCQLDNGDTESYEIKIQKIFVGNNESNKSMIIKVTDEKLLEETGGIIQGMSGTPIIQNGKFIGAITHVLVNDPTEGYAVFADMMLQELEN